MKLGLKRGTVELQPHQKAWEENADHTISMLRRILGAAAVDIQHIGDAGYAGIALPENIMTLSIAIRGKRWAYHTIASSINS